jgi:cobalt-zinc-cadmium efflux system outer membrane protein
VTLDEAIQLALSNRPAIQAAARRVEAATAACRQARAWRNPEAIVEVEGFGGDRDGLEESELTLGLAGGLDVFGRAGKKGKTADAALQAERARGESVRRRVEEEVRVAFHEVLVARERLEAAALMLGVSRETREAMMREVEAGKTARLRGLQAETALQAASLQHQAAITELDLATVRLSRLLTGTGSDPALVIAVGSLRTTLPNLDWEALQEELASGHPAIASDLWAAELQKRRSEQIGRERWPELGLHIGYRHDYGLEINDWVGGMTMELPILDRRKGADEEARRLEAAARNDARETVLHLLEKLEQGVASSRAAAALLERYDRELFPRSQEALELARLGYEEGKFGYLDLMDAQRSLVVSRAERSRVLISLDRALTDVEILLGRTLTPPSTDERED